MPTRPSARRTPRRKAPTARRGYGPEHQAARARYVAALRDGDPCAQCLHDGKPYHSMFRNRLAELDLSHNDDRTGYIGLSYARCNRQDGGRRAHPPRG